MYVCVCFIEYTLLEATTYVVYKLKLCHIIVHDSSFHATLPQTHHLYLHFSRNFLFNHKANLTVCWLDLVNAKLWFCPSPCKCPCECILA